MPTEQETKDQAQKDAAFLRGFSDGSTVNIGEVRHLHQIAERIGGPAPSTEGTATLLAAEKKELEVENKKLEEEVESLKAKLNRSESLAASDREARSAAEAELSSRNGGPAKPPAGGGSTGGISGAANPPAPPSGLQGSQPASGTTSKVPPNPSGGALSTKDLIPPASPKVPT